MPHPLRDIASRQAGQHALGLQIERFVAQGIDRASNTPEASGSLIRAEVPRSRKIVKDAGAKVN
ncbi:MAG: hypothetical protein AAB325_07360 [Pseudomonadota bacterium]